MADLPHFFIDIPTLIRVMQTLLLYLSSIHTVCQFSVHHDGWIMIPFFRAGDRITAGDVHFVEERAAHNNPDLDRSTILVPAGNTEFARDAAFGYHSSNLVDWVKEKAVKAAETEGGQLAPATLRVSSVSLQHLRVGGPAEVGKILAEAGGGCVVVNAVEERDLEVWKSRITAVTNNLFRSTVVLAIIRTSFVN